MTEFNRVPLYLISCSMYTFFFVRDEIAACTEKAYQCISLPEASRILYFESEKDMRAFAEKVSIVVTVTILFAAVIMRIRHE